LSYLCREITPTNPLPLSYGMNMPASVRNTFILMLMTVHNYQLRTT
jgi:hypothetical protein